MIEEIERKIKIYEKNMSDLLDKTLLTYMNEIELLKLAYGVASESEALKVASENGVAGPLEFLQKASDGYRRNRRTIEKIFIHRGDSPLPEGAADNAYIPFDQKLAKFYVENRSVINMACEMEANKKPRKWFTFRKGKNENTRMAKI